MQIINKTRCKGRFLLCPKEHKTVLIMSYLIHNQKSNVLMAANRDYLAIFKLKREGTKIELSEEVKNDVLHYEVDTLSRLMMYE